MFVIACIIWMVINSFFQLTGGGNEFKGFLMDFRR